MVPNMFRTKIKLLGVGLFALILINSGLLYTIVSNVKYHNERSKLAHLVYQDYLSLSKHAYILFKKHFKLVITEQEDHEYDAIKVRNEIYDNIKSIKVKIASEISHVSIDRENDEGEELLLLGEIEQSINQIFAEFEMIRSLYATGHAQQAAAQMLDTLNNSIAQRFTRLIDEALMEEHMEVIAADTQVSISSRWLTYTVVATALMALALCGILILLLLRRLKAPLDELLQGTQALTDGNLSYRLPVRGRDEFADIAKGFNTMAMELERHERLLEEARTNLEHRVDETGRELLVANDRLMRADQIRRQFFADISHELRTPLTVILSASQFTLRGADKSPQEYKDILQHVTTQAQHLSRLVDDLLFIARSEAGAAKLKREPVALAKLVGEVCADAQALADSKAIRIAFSASDDEAKVSGDPGRLRQLFLILLDNAVHYSNADSLIEVALNATSQGILVRVADSGVGIAANDLENVFERFYRGDQAADMNTKGSGLGLPVAKAIVEAHDGDITIESQPAHGTKVSVTLPGLGHVKVATLEETFSPAFDEFASS